MDEIFCANFLESQGGWAPCWMTWHANCYKCLGIGKFPVKMHWDVEGNPFFKQKQKEDEINHGVKGVRVLIPFQCKRCWMVNLEGHLPEPKLDEMYLMLIRQANLDAMGGRAVTTTVAHAGATKRVVRSCGLFRKCPPYQPVVQCPQETMSG